jgi:hypothetical protein
MAPYVNDAPNVKANVRTVLATSYMAFWGDLGNSTHQAGSGDHTLWSSHAGKYGYPTQGYVHAHDTSMSTANKLLFEKWLRNEIRAGRCKGIKYFNVLNRHWNMQTWSNYYAMQRGTLAPKYSGDVHLHVSYENGSIESDLFARFKVYKSTGTSPAVTPVAHKESNLLYWRVKYRKADGSITATTYLTSGTGCHPLTYAQDRWWTVNHPEYFRATNTLTSPLVLSSKTVLETQFGVVQPLTS